ncbi:MAG TPA: 30S ribosome-binding factor RbfA [Chitinophagales bacterium]|nr:30S ribosome-binding factor RbfA [Chitinophagales bacterium]HNL85300.1 30S ribosome-binding factor RbfA [Chitinophagales bacterium]
METIRQRQIAKTIQLALSEVIQQDLSFDLQGALVTIAGVKMTPDLLTARIYLSIFNHKNPDELLEYFDAHNRTIRGLLGKKIRNKVRQIPALEFFKEDSLDHVFEIEQLLKDVKEKDEEIAKYRTDEDESADA